jgi:lipoprotein-releasing system permease protein
VNFPYFIARRYLFSKHSLNVINLISLISVLGVFISSFAFVVVLSGFNGMEKLVIDMMDSFQPELVIKPNDKNIIFKDEIDLQKLSKIEGVGSYSRVIEEMTLYNFQDNWFPGKILGVDSTFNNIISLNNHLLDSAQVQGEINDFYITVGAKLMHSLNAPVIYNDDSPSQIHLYSPKKNKSIVSSSKPFSKNIFTVDSRFSYNPNVDGNYAISNFNSTQKILDQKGEYNWIAIKCKLDIKTTKQNLIKFLGEKYTVKTQIEQNELIYKTSQLEKAFILIILGFIFLLATFNIIGSLLMILIDKKNDILTLKALGIKRNETEKIFRWNGVMINFIGVLGGLILGYTLIFIQKYYGLITVDGLIVDHIPVEPLFSDFILILCIVTFVGFSTIYLPVKYFVKKLFIKINTINPN